MRLRVNVRTVRVNSESEGNWDCEGKNEDISEVRVTVRLRVTSGYG